MNIEDIRNDINQVDRKLVELFVKRMNLSKEVAKYKIKHQLPIYDPKREAAILSKLGEAFPDFRKEICHLYESIFEISKTYQKEYFDESNSS